MNDEEAPQMLDFGAIRRWHIFFTKIDRICSQRWRVVASQIYGRYYSQGGAEESYIQDWWETLCCIPMTWFPPPTPHRHHVEQVVRFFTFWTLSNPSAGCHSKVWERSPNFCMAAVTCAAHLSNNRNMHVNAAVSILKRKIDQPFFWSNWHTTRHSLESPVWLSYCSMLPEQYRACKSCLSLVRFNLKSKVENLQFDWQFWQIEPLNLDWQ